MRRSFMKRFVWSGATFVSLVSALLAQGTWTWQQQCDSNEWRAICYDYDGCGYDQNNNPVHRYFNNWGLSQCSVSPGLPGPGSICIFPAGADALLNSNVDILSVGISDGAVFSWRSGTLTLRNPSDNSAGTLTNTGILRMVGYWYLERGLSGVLVNTGTLVHEDGSTYFNGASLRNSGTAELRAGNWYNHTGTNSLVNTGTLNKTTTGIFTISVPMQQQGATVNVQEGTLYLSASSNTHQNVSWSVASGATLVLQGTHTFSGTHTGWSVASGATLVLDGTHTFSGTHSSEIAGTLVQTYGTVQAGSEGATFNFTGTGYQWVRHTLNGGSAGLTNTGILRMVGYLERGLSGVLVNTGTLVHEDGSTYFNGASLRNSGTAELHAGYWYNNTGTNSLVNTGTLNKTTTNSFTITVPMQQQGATVNVQAGTLTLSADSNTHQNVSWSVASGATLVLGGTHTFSGTHTGWSVASGATLVLDGTHTFSGTHSSEIAGTLVQTYGTVQAGSEGATFNFTGTGYQWVRHTLNGGSAGLTNTGILRMVGYLERGLSGVLVNTGTLVHEDGSTYFNGASLRNSGTAELHAGYWYNNTGTNSLVNTGTLNKTTTNSFTITVPMQQQGATVNVQAGTLTLSADSNTHQNVSWSVASGATLVLGGTHTFSGTHTGWSVASGATLVLDGTHTFSGTHSSEIAGTLVQTYGTVQAGSEGATFNFTGTGYQWVRHTLNGGSAGLTNTGILRMVGYLERGLSGVLVNTGTLVHEDGSTYFNGASLRNSGTAELHAGYWYNNTGTNSLVNTGTLNKTTTNSFTITVPMQQQGATVNVQAGTLTLSADSNTHQNVSWSVASGATLVLGGTHTFSGTHTGWSVASGATLVLDGTHTFSGTHSSEIAGTLVQTYGTVQAGSEGATFNFTGTGYQWVRHTLNGGSAGLTNTGILRMVGYLERGLSGVLVNTGTLVHEDGSTYFNGASLRNSGTAEVRSGGWYDTTGANSLVNTGTLRKVSPDPNNPTSFTITVNTTNSGLIEVQNGTLSVSNLTQTAGEARIRRGATLSVSNPLAMQGGKLTGAGQLDGDLTNTAGTIAPGIDAPDQPDLNPLGILTINGNLTLGNNAVFEVELAGTDNSDPANPQYDQLIVGQSDYTRTVQLNGTLRVKARDGYTPATGDTFDILVRSGSWNRTGEFHTVEVDPDTLPCIAFEVQYLSDRVRLIARLTTDPDVNGDGCVDDADLLAVLFAFGQTGSNLAEDINCDQVVDDADLLSVLFAFGSGC
jgi:lysophospholipase L1-like esterase